LPENDDLSPKHVGWLTFICKLYLYFVNVLVYINEYKNNVKFLEKTLVAHLVSKFYAF